VCVWAALPDLNKMDGWIAGGEGARCPLPKNSIPTLGPLVLRLRSPPPCEGKKFAPSK